jgi:hypothetical protein
MMDAANSMMSRSSAMLGPAVNQENIPTVVPLPSVGHRTYCNFHATSINRIKREVKRVLFFFGTYDIRKKGTFVSGA